MATPVQMPQMGESVVEGTIITWLKAEGDAVEVDEPIVEVSTDKVDTEIPSPVAGKLTKILVQEGETVEVGTALCEVDEGGAASGDGKAAKEEAKPKEDAPSKEEAPPSEEEAPEEAEERPAAQRREPAEEEGAPQVPSRPAAATRAPSGPPGRDAETRGPGQVLSPLVRRLAREHDVDLSQVRGTGSGGRITKDDVLAYVERGPKAREAPPSRKAPPAAQQGEGEHETTESVSHIRKRIAEHMLRSLETSARAWNAIEVDMENVASVRAKANPGFREREGYSLTYLPFISRAVCDALAQHPLVNASISEDLSEVTHHRYVNLGIAVATDYGLIVPVIRGAEGMNVIGLARSIHDLADKARTKTLTPDDVGGSTFSITNPGPFGSFLSLPVINQPNVAILATEVIEKRVVVVDDMIAIRQRTFMSMSWDHRLLDGSDAMGFLATLKENLETWDFSNEVAQP